MVQDFVVFFKDSLQKIHDENVNSRLATGNVPQENYMRFVGTLDGFKIVKDSVDTILGNYEKSKESRAIN